MKVRSILSHFYEDQDHMPLSFHQVRATLLLLGTFIVFCFSVPYMVSQYKEGQSTDIVEQSMSR